MSDITFEAPNKFGVTWLSWYEDQVRIKEGYELVDGRWEKKYEERFLNDCIIQKTFCGQHLVAIKYFDKEHRLHRDDGPAHVFFYNEEGSRFEEYYYQHGQLIRSVWVNKETMNNQH